MIPRRKLRPNRNKPLPRNPNEARNVPARSDPTAPRPTSNKAARTADHLVRLGIEAHTDGQLLQAQNLYVKALEADPNHVVAHMNLAVIYNQTGQLEWGLKIIRRACELDPTNSLIYINRAMLALKYGELPEAIEFAHKAVDADPNIENLQGLALVTQLTAHPEEAVKAYRRALELKPDHADVGANCCYAQTLCDATTQELFEQRKLWHANNGSLQPVAPHTNDHSTDRPLRVGYVSGDFKIHSASSIFANVLYNHTSAVEAYAYSTIADDLKDNVVRDFQDLFGDRWRNISALDDAAADALIRNDQIDILVDLSGHTEGNRLKLFTRKPAPVQVTAWGFALGTGCPEIDYFFADPVVVPPKERQYFAEQIYDLPCVMTMRFPNYAHVPPWTDAPYKANGFVTFGCFARHEKMSDAYLRTCCEIMRRTPGSVLLLKDKSWENPYARARLGLLADGIDPERFVFLGATGHDVHLWSMQHCDLCLDSWPHCGGCAAIEFLWAGVPLLCKLGRHIAGRLSASLLTAIGRTEWIAESTERYIELAVQFATYPQLLAEARKTLRAELIRSPVITGYVGAVEEAYKSMWKAWCTKV